MTSQVAGRHRRRLTSPVVRGPHGGRRFRPPGTRRAGHTPAEDRRVFTLTLSAGLAGITAAALVGSLAPLNSTWAADRGSGPVSSPPWSADTLGSLSGVLGPQEQTSPTSTRPPGGRHRKSHNHGPGAAGTSAVARIAAPAPEAEVSYFVDREWTDGFQGQVRVVNHGTRPITGWQAVIALPRDRVTWFWNASGSVRHHVMRLHPQSVAEVVPAGGTVSMFFTATGPETTPRACAFDGVSCG
ncbi:MAG: cellulose binding domain-containing protein [Streptosporangiaceae bacterium]